MTAVSVSTRIDQDTSRSPDVTQRMSGTFAVSCPMPTCQNTTHDRTADTMRQPDVTSSEGATRLGEDVLLRIEDDGPGIDPDQREAIFRRFHSERPSGEAFGRHSGLGLAIARTIIEGHRGAITVYDREDGQQGASLLIILPAAAQG